MTSASYGPVIDHIHSHVSVWCLALEARLCGQASAALADELSTASPTINH